MIQNAFKDKQAVFLNQLLSVVSVVCYQVAMHQSREVNAEKTNLLRHNNNNNKKQTRQAKLTGKHCREKRQIYDLSDCYKKFRLALRFTNLFKDYKFQRWH